MANQNNLTKEERDKVHFHFHPEDLKQTLQNFEDVEEEIMQKLKKIFDQKIVQIKSIIFRLEQNQHLGKNTYLCKVSLVSDSPNSDFNHKAEGHEMFPELFRECVNELVEFVFRKKDKLKNH